MQPEPLKGPLCTRPSLINDLQNLGLVPGDTVLVHSSLSKIGWVNGGAEALTQSLLDVITSQGTLVVPTQTSSNSDPAGWIAPPVPEEWWQTIRDTRPAYDPRTTRTERMGVLAETVRTWPGAVRSMHPQTSFGAVGTKAEFVTDKHALDNMLGENSPLARLEDLDAKVLLLGVGFCSCTCFHLAEYRTEMPKADTSFAIMEDGVRKWKTVSDVSVNGEDFAELGDDFLKTGSVRKGKIGAADCYLFSLSEAVRFAEKWLISHRCNRT